MRKSQKAAERLLCCSVKYSSAWLHHSLSCDPWPQRGHVYVRSCQRLPGMSEFKCIARDGVLSYSCLSINPAVTRRPKLSFGTLLSLVVSITLLHFSLNPTTLLNHTSISNQKSVPPALWRIRKLLCISLHLQISFTAVEGVLTVTTHRWNTRTCKQAKVDNWFTLYFVR